MSLELSIQQLVNQSQQLATHARSPDNAYTDQRWARAERSSSIPARPPHTCRSGTAQSRASLCNNRRQSKCSQVSRCPKCRTAATKILLGTSRVRPVSFRPLRSLRNSRRARIAATINRSETWPDTVALPGGRETRPLEHHNNRLFCCLRSMLHGILAALVVPSHCTLHHA
jgi:hypothetical protein